MLCCNRASKRRLGLRTLLPTATYSFHWSPASSSKWTSCCRLIASLCALCTDCTGQNSLQSFASDCGIVLNCVTRLRLVTRLALRISWTASCTSTCSSRSQPQWSSRLSCSWLTLSVRMTLRPSFSCCTTLDFSWGRRTPKTSNRS